MNERAIIAALKRIRREVDKALEELSEPTHAIVGKCPWCAQPIYENQRISRGVHFTTCYKFAKKLVDDGEATWEQFEKEGKTLPKGTPGRKPLTIEEHRQSQAAEEAAKFTISQKRKARKK